MLNGLYCSLVYTKYHHTQILGIYQRKKEIMNKTESSLYIRVRNQLVVDIESGVLKPNDSLPSERMLSEKFKVSRMTARQALIQLEKEGFAYKDGRRCRFVSEPIVNYDLTKTISFFTSSASETSELCITVIGCETIAANEEQCNRLNLSIGSEIHCYSRLCRLGRRPAFIEEEYVSAERFPGLCEHDLAQPLSLLFESAYGIRSVRDQVTISQIYFSTKILNTLELEEATSGILLEQTVFDEADQPISFGCQFWRGDVARFSADIRY
jgi:GntR family transcriptional regulator